MKTEQLFGCGSTGTRRHRLTGFCNYGSFVPPSAGFPSFLLGKVTDSLQLIVSQMCCHNPDDDVTVLPNCFSFNTLKIDFFDNNGISNTASHMQFLKISLSFKLLACRFGSIETNSVWLQHFEFLQDKSLIFLLLVG